MIEIVEPKVKTINLGLEFLRFFLCLWIVIIHCSEMKNSHKKYLNKGFHVPTFILISFYFYFRTISQRAIPKIISRFQRLFIPYVIWPLIIFVVNHILFYFFKVRIVSYNLKMNDIYVQLLIGSRYHGIFWFQFNLIFLSLFFTIVSFIFQKNFMNICKILGALSFYLHISGINQRFFYSFNPCYSINIGSIIELLPLAVVGLILGSKNLIYKIKINTSIFYFLMIFSIYILFKYDIFVYKPGLRYPNILLNIFASILLFIAFCSIPFEKIEKGNLFKIISKVTKYTGGIYYLHPRIRRILQKIFIYFYKRRTYSNSILIYITCYETCFFGEKIFINSKLKYLFI